MTTTSSQLAVEMHAPVCRSTAGSGRGAGWRRFGVGAVLLAVSLLLGGCRTVGTVLDTTRALQDAGFNGVKVSFNRVRGTDAVRVKVRASSGPAVTPELQAAHVVWDKFRFRFDAVEVKIGDGPVTTLPYSRLQQAFGPRPAGYDSHTVGNDLATGARRAALVAGIVALVVVGGVVLTIVLVVRHRRRRPPAQPQWYPGAPGQPAWPQPGPGGWPPPGQPGWPQPGQQQWPQPGQQQWPPPAQPPTDQPPA